MSRDHRKLRVFALADAAVVAVYRLRAAFPPEERYGLQAQLRRAAVSACANIVEGSARRSTGEYLSFLNISAGSAAEARYLLELSCRLGFLEKGCVENLVLQYASLCSGLEKLIGSLEMGEGTRRGKASRDFSSKAGSTPDHGRAAGPPGASNLQRPSPEP